MGSETACRQLLSTPTVAIYHYYSAQGRQVQFSHLPGSTAATASASAGCSSMAAASSSDSELNSSMQAYGDSTDWACDVGHSNDGSGGRWGSGGGRDSRTVCCMPSSCPGNSFTSSGTTPCKHTHTLYDHFPSLSHSLSKVFKVMFVDTCPSGNCQRQTPTHYKNVQILFAMSYNYLALDMSAKYCDQHVCWFVCMFVCLSACVFRKSHVRISQNLLYVISGGG